MPPTQTTSVASQVFVAEIAGDDQPDHQQDDAQVPERETRRGAVVSLSCGITVDIVRTSRLLYTSQKPHREFFSGARLGHIFRDDQQTIRQHHRHQRAGTLRPGRFGDPLPILSREFNTNITTPSIRR